MKTGIGKAVALLGIAVLLFSAIPAHGQPHGECPAGKGVGKEAGFSNLIEKLNLSPEQQAQLKENRQKYHELSKGLREELREEHTALRQELNKPESDEKAVNKLTAYISEIQAKMVKLRTRKILEIKKILTPEQFQKFNELAEERHKSFKEGFKHGFKKGRFGN